MSFIKFSLLLLSWSLSTFLVSQTEIKGKWKLAGGASSNNVFKTSPCLNIRYISPRFKWSDYELSEEEEKHVDNFKNTRLMLELIYAPPLEVLCTSFNAQSRLLHSKRFSLNLYGGLKFFIIQGADFTNKAPSKTGKDFWYMNMGILCQLNLGVISPFADIGGDHIITIGTEFNFHWVYKKPKKRYKLHATKIEK